MAYTVHEKNPPPEIGFNADPTSAHDDEQEALDAAGEMCQDPATYSNTVFVWEVDTNRTWTVQYMQGEVTVGYDEGVPYLVPAEDEHILVTYDSQENAVTVREEVAEDSGAKSIFLDEAETVSGDFEQKTVEIERQPPVMEIPAEEVPVEDQGSGK